ncbi:MAG: EAL domain-containing protein [Lachnospiraceae bacterium]|nr:MAG: EAL domain-containing protein [Lachnospiraceae bacterium]
MSDIISDLTDTLREFLEIEQISACILQRGSKNVFEYFTDPDQEKYLRSQISADELRNAASSFADYDVADVSDIQIGENGKIRGLAIRNPDGKVRFVIFLFTDGTDDTQFDRITKVLSESLTTYCNLKEELSQRTDDIRKNRDDISRLERSRRMFKSLSKLTEDINFKVSFDRAADDIIKQSMLCVDPDVSLIVKEDSGVAQIIKQSGSAGTASLGSLNGMPVSDIPFMDGKTYTISSDSIISNEFKQFFVKCGISAGIFVSIGSTEDGLYLCFLKTDSEKTWQSDEISFVRQAGEILRTKVEFAGLSNAVAEADDFIRTVFDNSSSAVAVFDASTKEDLYMNEAAKKLFEDSLNDELFRRQFLIPGPSEDQDKMTGEFAASGTGDIYQVNMTRASQRGGLKVLVFAISDITKQKQYQKKLTESADIDDLTGLYNRHRFHADFETCINDAKRGQGMGSLILLDLDDFNELNDGLGHVLADKFLKKTAWSIQQIVRKEAQCYRVGGDEFAILIPSSDIEEMKKLMQKIQSRFEKPFSLDGNDYYCTAGMGAVNFPQDGDEEDGLLSKADFALHEAKAKGKNKSDIFADVEIKMPPDRLNVEKALREAVADDCREFLVYYQPVVDITNGESRCCGAEALVRWDSHKLGFMPPSKFIPMAEYLGLIIPIGEHVLIEACRTCHHWNEFGHPEYKVNVNLSVLQLLQNDVVHTIANALKVSGIEPDNLVLEVTEGMAINDMDKIKRVLEDIHELGVRFALDDFGTGYSSLSHMKQLPLDELKIDKCFIDDIDSDSYSDAFVRSVSQLADAVDLNVVVEGVEREKQQDVLKNMDVDMIQGFLYDKPLPKDQFEKRWL